MKQSSNKQCEICKIFSNANRIDILVALRDKPKTVSEIVKKTDMPQSVVSQHLAILRNLQVKVVPDIYIKWLKLSSRQEIEQHLYTPRILQV